jgi:hypothetical protein
MSRGSEDGSYQPTDWVNSCPSLERAVELVEDPRNRAQVIKAMQNLEISDDELTNGLTPASYQAIAATFSATVLRKSSGPVVEPSASRSPNTERWKTIESLLDQVLDGREAAEERRVSKSGRLHSRKSGRPGGSTRSNAGAPLARPKPAK